MRRWTIEFLHLKEGEKSQEKVRSRLQTTGLTTGDGEDFLQKKKSITQE